MQIRHVVPGCGRGPERCTIGQQGGFAKSKVEAVKWPRDEAQFTRRLKNRAGFISRERCDVDVNFRERFVRCGSGRGDGRRRSAGGGAGGHRADPERCRRSTAAPIPIASSAIGRSSRWRSGPWGGSNGVAIDRDGKTVWATDRCSPGTAPGCLGTKANPVHHFDESGKEIRSFGGGMFVWPHGIHVDRDGNVWVTDARAASADELAEVSGRRQQGQRRRQVQPRRQGADDARASRA